jgi:hypothetical protein
MSSGSHEPASKGMTTREQSIVNRLCDLADGDLDPDVKPIVAEGLALILELIGHREKWRNFDEYCDRRDRQLDEE